MFVSEEMRLYYCFIDDQDITSDTQTQAMRTTHEAGYATGANAPKPPPPAPPGTQPSQTGRGTPNPTIPKTKPPKKEKTPAQLARSASRAQSAPNLCLNEAISAANTNILEIAQLDMKLTRGGTVSLDLKAVPDLRLRSDVLRKALIEQMADVDVKLKEAKTSLEQAIAQGLDLSGFTRALDQQNQMFKDQMRHVSMHLPKATKAKAKAKAQAAA